MWRPLPILATCVSPAVLPKSRKQRTVSAHAVVGQGLGEGLHVVRIHRLQELYIVSRVELGDVVVAGQGWPADSHLPGWAGMLILKVKVASHQRQNRKYYVKLWEFCKIKPWKTVAKWSFAACNTAAKWWFIFKISTPVGGAGLPA